MFSPSSVLDWLGAGDPLYRGLVEDLAEATKDGAQKEAPEGVSNPGIWVKTEEVKQKIVSDLVLSILIGKESDVKNGRVVFSFCGGWKEI